MSKKTCPEKEAAVVKMHEETKLSLSKIANLVGISATAAKRIVVSSEIPIRPDASKKKIELFEKGFIKCSKCLKIKKKPASSPRIILA